MNKDITMSIEEKAKAYDEAVKKAREIAANPNRILQLDDFEELFPGISDESEDERIRKALIDGVSQIRCKGDVTREQMIAYLEKQKEHQETCTKFLAKILKHSAEGFRNVLKKKGIDYIPHESFWTGTAGTFSKQECNEFYKWMNDMTMELVTEETPEYKKGFKDGLDAAKKEQKPELVQQPTITYTYNSNASRDERLKAALLALLNSDLLKVKEGGYFTKQDLIDWVERIPTDRPAWSEEDERIRKELCSYLLGQLGRQKDNLMDAKFDEWITWLEKQKEQKPSIFPPGLGEVHWNPIPSGKDIHKWNLPEDFEEAVYKVANFISPFDSQDELRRVSHRFAEQLMSLAKKELIKKPVEWSEEDELMRTAIIQTLERFGGRGTTGMQIDWLKSLHPIVNANSEKVNVNWSEEDEKNLELVTDCVYEFYPDPVMKYKLKDWLKNLRPGWKPSEEQIRVLNWAANGLMDTCIAAPEMRAVLRDLYNDLLKLK